MKSTLLILLAAASLSAAAGPGPDDRAQIDQLYAKFRRAMMAKSVSGVTVLETTDFKLISRGETLKKADAEGELKGTFSLIRTVRKFTLTLHSVEIKGAKATVVSHFTFEGTVSSNNPQDHSLHVFSVEGKTKDTLAKGSLGWQIAVSEDLSSRMLQDGRPAGSGG